MSQNCRQFAYNQLREKIVVGELLPGTRLVDRDMAQLLGVSRTPVREAIRQLESDGLVQQTPQLGAFVRQLTGFEYIELFELREVLEGYASARAAERAHPEHLQEMRTQCDALMAAMRQIRKSKSKLITPELRNLAVACDMNFHQALFKASGNPWVSELVGNVGLLGHIASYHDPVKTTPQYLLELVTVWREHRRILRLIRTGHSAAARHAVGRHLRISKNNWLQKLSGQYEPGRYIPPAVSSSTEIPNKVNLQTSKKHSSRSSLSIKGAKR